VWGDHIPNSRASTSATTRRKQMAKAAAIFVMFAAFFERTYSTYGELKEYNMQLRRRPLSLFIGREDIGRSVDIEIDPSSFK
jgi:hypothetical protein